MSNKELEDKIIEQYQQDEKMMILVFAQWCINNDLDPFELYLEAYPTQGKNPALLEAIDLTVTKQESEDIAVESVLGVLQLFGNDDLAFVVTQQTNNNKED
ncbi:hypothetical protein GH741_13490 [Aquibacillus halophilus]|uniref:YxiS n=1 Tax=Aquibacillus halophilus TaxID=930132 RepID=A0A6A8DDA8_9BACI|nr:hypothetical protein [Aquibacillus halophilus]MRH43685.1 hypothetical protein [Aquibacillus halophilus]